MACASVEELVLCSAHLESPRYGGEFAKAQAREYQRLVSDHYGDATTVLAGDFNLDRAEADAILRPRGYTSADVGPTMEDHQIDMIYGPWDEASGETYCDRQASDHCYLMSTAAVSRPRPPG